ncbi:Uncharacterised protein [Legionella sainthelensi]|uniref:hypothetical protein n=1 Tax=Legionella sainthelensi TaxID=28087 RepID=UPI000E2041E1|nr:hypothetical protein [Legionella sainthelensi]VEB34105.1 Uncharacterised protein [Legionella sainthelensi]
MLFNSLSALLDNCTESIPKPDVLFLSIGGHGGSKEQRFPAYLDNYKGTVLSILVDAEYQNILKVLYPNDHFIEKDNIYKQDSREYYLACCNTKLSSIENTPELQQLKNYFKKLLDAGKTIIIADHSINFPACCSLVIASMYNDFKIQYKDKIQMYIQAGGGPTLYLNENLFFPLSGYSFSPDNLMYARQMIHLYKDHYKDDRYFSQHIEYLLRLSSAEMQRVTEQDKLPEFQTLTTKEKRDNYWSQYEAIYKKSRLDFNLPQDFDYYPKLCIEYGFVSKQKKWTLEATISPTNATFFNRTNEKWAPLQFDTPREAINLTASR